MNKFANLISKHWRGLAPPLFLFVATLVVLWQYDPLHRSIYHDPGIFAYLSQLVAQGFALHKYAFNEQASLTFLVGGTAMRVGDVFGLHHLISFRFAGMLVMAGVVTLTYITGALFTRSRAIAFFAGLVMLGYNGYAMRAATTLEPKSLALALGLATIYFLFKRKWVLAGACAGAAGLAWQIAWGYLIVALLLAAIQGGKNFSTRARAVLITVIPALVLFAFYFIYFYWKGAHIEMIQQTFLAPIVMHQVGSKSFDARIFKLAKTFYLGFGAHVVFGILGASGFLTWLGAHLVPDLKGLRVVLHRVLYFFFQNRRTSATLLVVFGFLFYSYLDFQNYPDWIPLLPFISMFAAWLVWTICLRAFKRWNASPITQRVAFTVVAIVFAVISTFHVWQPMGSLSTRNTWQDQQRVADELNQTLGADARVWLIGKAEMLFFMRRVNVNKYIYLFGRVDAGAQEFEPGGFRGMVDNALAQKPVLVSLARATAKNFSNRANAKYIESKMNPLIKLKRCRIVGGGRFYVQPAQAHTLFPQNGQGCLKQN